MRLGKYAARFKRFLNVENIDSSEILVIDKLIVRLDKVFSSKLFVKWKCLNLTLFETCQEMRAKKGKNLELLSAAEDLTRAMNGARLTCCKSGKVWGLCGFHFALE